MSHSTRPLEPRDRLTVASIVHDVGIFTEDEIKTACELIDAWLNVGEKSDYICHVIEDEAQVRGYICFGPTPLTHGTFDLYWIAVDPRAQGSGYGQALICHAETEVKSRGGRLLIIETASQEAYAGTVRFYQRAGYELVSRIPDFYRTGDDKLTYAKRLS
jgi:ribosomal protein S18 acetylase RimI-like enzyme